MKNWVCLRETRLLVSSFFPFQCGVCEGSLKEAGVTCLNACKEYMPKLISQKY